MVTGTITGDAVPRGTVTALPEECDFCDAPADRTIAYGCVNLHVLMKRLCGNCGDSFAEGLRNNRYWCYDCGDIASMIVGRFTDWAIRYDDGRKEYSWETVPTMITIHPGENITWDPRRQRMSIVRGRKYDVP